MTEGVKNFLIRLGLDRYYDMFVAKGFDSEGDFPFLDETDLDAMYITAEADRQSILRSAQSFKPSKEYQLYEWLRSRGLEYYFISFVQSELVDIPEIGRLNLPDEQLYDELEITLPGHKRRLERAVRELSKKQRMELPRVAKAGLDTKMPLDSVNPLKPETEIPIAYGRWGKPRCLSDAKYDFLMIDAAVVSTTDPRDKVDLEFMVDSGSDVVTIRQEVLDTMDLELIGPIRSKGVHASRLKNLYRANLQIGNQTLEIEVMGESYDSIGSRVMRHFRHYINGNNHIWLKGDFVNSVISSAPLVKGVNPEQACKMEEIVPSVKQEVEQSDNQELSPLPSDQEKMEEGEITPADLAVAVSKVQKDFVSVKKEEEDRTVETQDTSNVEHINISFNFKKSDTAEEKKESEVEDVDEPDRLTCENKDSDIIDVRPIIAANRKRQANEISGFDPNSCNTNKMKKMRLHNGDNTIRTINQHNNNLVLGVENQNIQTVMKKRSVYYMAEDSEPES